MALCHALGVTCGAYLGVTVCVSCLGSDMLCVIPLGVMCDVASLLSRVCLVWWRA